MTVRRGESECGVRVGREGSHIVSRRPGNVPPISHKPSEANQRSGSLDCCLRLCEASVRDMTLADPSLAPHHHRVPSSESPLGAPREPRRVRRKWRLDDQLVQQALHNDPDHSARDCHLLPELPSLMEMPQFVCHRRTSNSAPSVVICVPPAGGSARLARHGGWPYKLPLQSPPLRPATGSAFRHVSRSETRERVRPARTSSWHFPASPSGSGAALGAPKSALAQLLQQCDAAVPAFCAEDASPYPSIPFRPHKQHLRAAASTLTSPRSTADTEETTLGSPLQMPVPRSISLNDALGDSLHSQFSCDLLRSPQVSALLLRPRVVYSFMLQ